MSRRQVKPSLLVAASGWIICLFILTPPSRAQGWHVPPACKKTEAELNSLKAERTDLQNSLKKAAPPEKPFLTSQIKKLNPQISAKENELVNCAKANGGKPALAATFNGTATMTTNNPKVAGPFVQKVSIKVTYTQWLHDELLISNFPPITVGPFDTPIGDNTTTVTLIDGGGKLNPKTGMVEVTVRLHFHHSLALAADSDLFITLSTEAAGGSRLDSKGNITLVGTSSFKGGYLGGDSCTLVLKGTLLPLP